MSETKLLLTGPPSSGKTHFFLDRLRESLSRDESDFRLLVPTATMAEHFRNQLAREGLVFRPSLVSTLSKFVERWLEDLPQIPRASLELLVAEAIRKLNPAEFREVADFAGFHACVAGVIEEISSAGYDSSAIAAEAVPGLLAVYREVEAALRQRKQSLRGQRLLRAAERISGDGLPGIRSVFLDGFFSLAAPELAVIDALCRHASVSVSLPTWAGSEAARAALLAKGFAERKCGVVRTKPKAVLLAAATVEQEAEEIVRRILVENSAGRPFREIGIVVRSKEPYVAILRAVLGRAGIPARFYFAEPLADHSLVRYLSGVVDAMIGSWDFENTLEVLRLTPCGRASDHFEFDVRERMPGSGIEELAAIARDRRLKALLGSLQCTGEWRELRLTPVEWAGKVKTLTTLFRPPKPDAGADHETALRWRSYAVAIEAFQRAMDEAGQAFETAEAIPLTDFWAAARTVLRLSTLRTPDRRRNVVHVLDVYEARQWELPVVFVCGLLEKQFPLYHPLNPVLPDETRRRLREREVHLRTSAERDSEEDFLFDIATTRATELLTLSFPRFGRSGDANLRSFHVDRFLESNPDVIVENRFPAWRLVGPSPRLETRSTVIYAEDLRERLRVSHKKISPTAAETYLQCPFQFFARYTLKLKEPPPEPAERLDVLVQGQILHRVLAEFVKRPEALEESFDRIFAEASAEARVVPGYRTEAVRAELWRNLQRFVREAWLAPPARVETEYGFRISLHGLVDVSGRIDRVDFLNDGRVLLIDYKYSSKANVRRRVKAHFERERIQGGLYAVAARQELGREAAGFLFAAMRGEPEWEGWHSDSTADEVQRLSEIAVEATLKAVGEIREGRVLPKPLEPEQCRYCEYLDVCRVETAAQAATAEGGEE